MGDPAVIRIFDTTLRDGEQSPGATMTTPEKIQVAEQLVRLHVDIIEAGFPAASPGDLEAVKEIARHVQDVAIAGLARAAVSDIDTAWEAVCDAEQPVIHVFLATSALHLTHTLKLGFEEALRRVKEMVAYARNLCPTVEFSAEDATRSDWEYLCRVFEAAIKSGATTINGLGERAGNTAMEEVVMALRTRPDCFGNLDTRINARAFLATSQLVSKITGIPVQPNKSVVGANAFAHEAGIHQDGMLKNRMTYEIMTPQSVGWADTKLVLGKHSGRHGLDARLRQLGCKLNAEQLKVAYSRFVSMADHKKHLTDADLLYIAETSMETFSAI